MAEKLENFPERAPWGRKSKYPWNQWFDGGIWRLEQGVDFDPTTTPHHMAIGIYGKAKRSGIKVRVAWSKGKNFVTLQAFPETSPVKRLQHLIDWMDQQGYLPGHYFAFPDGDLWWATGYGDST